jgi:hypothetical protein
MIDVQKHNNCNNILWHISSKEELWSNNVVTVESGVSYAVGAAAV